MPSKEDILIKHGYNKDLIGSGFHDNVMLPAMDEYSKGMAIAFQVWQRDNNIERYEGPDSDLFYFVYDMSHAEKAYTIEELYNLFLKSTQQ